MYCENCGNQKNMYLALILSLILTGVGTIYAGKVKKGLILLALRFIFATITALVPSLGIINVIIWIFGIYDAYHETQKANGKRPNPVRDFIALDGIGKVLTLLFVALIITISVGSFVDFTTPTQYHVSNSHYTTTTTSGIHSPYGGVDDSPSTIARNDPDWYYEHYEYGDNPRIDDYLESQGYD